MLDAIREFISSNAALLVSLVALAVSLRANSAVRDSNRIAASSKTDADRLRKYELRTELLNEIDRQHTKTATVLMLTAQKLMLFQQFPHLHAADQQEFQRLTGNLEVMRRLQGTYEERRSTIERIQEDGDITEMQKHLADTRRMTIHLDKEILHEERGLQAFAEQARLGKPEA